MEKKHNTKLSDLEGEINGVNLDIENHRQKGDQDRQKTIEEEIK